MVVSPEASAKTSKAKRRRSKRAARKVALARLSGLSISAAAIVSKLPLMGPSEVAALWVNALRLSAAGLREDQRTEAQAVLDAVETIWLVRATGAPAGWFQWPSTDIFIGDGELNPEGWPVEGMLRFLGYSVGEHGEPQGLRWAILKRVFEGELPPVFPGPYMEAWGQPSSPRRLHKMADCLASFARSAKRRGGAQLRIAIRDWEGDLQHLHDSYYAGRFGFDWPSAKV